MEGGGGAVVEVQHSGVREACAWCIDPPDIVSCKHASGRLERCGSGRLARRQAVQACRYILGGSLGGGGVVGGERMANVL